MTGETNLWKIDNWPEIWERIGRKPTTDLRVLDGSERHPPGLDRVIVANLIERMQLVKTDRVLEVGCGAGMLAQHFVGGGYDYTGIDLSSSSIEKFKKIIGERAFVAPANELPFENESFDKVFSWGVFMYFPKQSYASQAINEMRRVAKSPKTVYVGDLPTKSHRKSHLLYLPEEFDGKIFPGSWLPGPGEERFEVLLNDSPFAYKPREENEK